MDEIGIVVGMGEVVVLKDVRLNKGGGGGTVRFRNGSWIME